jgi:hypothetical protein
MLSGMFKTPPLLLMPLLAIAAADPAKPMKFDRDLGP